MQQARVRQAAGGGGSAAGHQQAQAARDGGAAQPSGFRAPSPSGRSPGRLGRLQGQGGRGGREGEYDRRPVQPIPPGNQHQGAATRAPPVRMLRAAFMVAAAGGKCSARGCWLTQRHPQRGCRGSRLDFGGEMCQLGRAEEAS